ncbi:MAG: YncE family protein, partial [Planctomycetota bacterium]
MIRCERPPMIRRCLTWLSCLALLDMGVGLTLAQEAQIESTTDLVGRSREEYIVTPINQLLTPYGKQVELAGLRPQVLALSPDGKRLVVSGKTSELLVIDVDRAEVVQRVALPGDAQKEPPTVVSPNILQPDLKGQVSFTGLVFSHDGKRLYLSNVNGSIKVFTFDAAGAIQPSHTIALPEAGAPRRKAEIPSGLRLSADDTKLYVCGNLSNKLLEIDTAQGTVLRSWNVGMAPYDAMLVGDKVFVSNWGGRRPTAGDLTGPAGRGTEVRVDPVRHISSEGSVSIIHLAEDKVAAEILTGLHASALAVSPDQKYVVCANAGSDHLSIIDVASESVSETIWAKHKPSDLFGASPNALAFDASGKTLFVANGTQNSIAVFHFDPEDKGDTKLQGLIPAGWFPGALVFDASRKVLCVANIKGLPITPKKHGNGIGFNSHQYHGSVSLMPVPNAVDLAKLSERAAKNIRRGSIHGCRHSIAFRLKHAGDTGKAADRIAGAIVHRIAAEDDIENGGDSELTMVR